MPFYHRPPQDRSRLQPLSPQRVSPPRPGGADPSAEAREVGYAVIDLETTGLSPTTDAILEIGLVVLRPDGTEDHSWSTLVSPDGSRDVGPTAIHGIRAEDLRDAPALTEVADLLVSELSGRVSVAHNARFDLGFLTHALSRSGHLARGARVPRVCTMEWARHFISTPSRRLLTCCEVSGVSIGQHHSALDDARACAGLLRHYLAVGRGRGEDAPAWQDALSQAATFTGWSWDTLAAPRQYGCLLARKGEGVPRTQVPPHT